MSSMSQVYVRDQLLQNDLRKRINRSPNVGFSLEYDKRNVYREYTRLGGWNSGYTGFPSSCIFFKSPIRVKNRWRKTAQTAPRHFSAMKVFKVLFSYLTGTYTVRTIGKHWRNQMHQELNELATECPTEQTEYKQTFESRGWCRWYDKRHSQGQTSYLATN